MSTTACPHCGKAHREGARFCSATGKLIDALSDSPARPQAAPVSRDAGQFAPGGLHEPIESSFFPGVTGKLPANYMLQDHLLIVRKVGQGGMAAVYQAIDTWRPGVHWAIKEMSDAALSLRDREYAVRAFLTEAELLRTLSHENLPRVVDAFTENGKHYLVMEFVQGRSLHDLLLERETTFDEGEVLAWALQLCDVLTYLHEQEPKIIFRDLKPSNIMLSPDGRVKLVDFGIARFFKPGQSSDTMALGTPGYAAPEAVAGQTDERSDIYGLCITLHQLLTRFDPAGEMFNPPRLRSLNPAVSMQMERIVMRGLQFQREARWRNVAELRAELAELSHAQPRRPMVVQPAGAAPAAAPHQPMPQPAARTAGYAPTALVPATPPPAAPTNRPTTRLLMTASRLSGRQLAALAAALLIFVIVAAWVLTPVLDALDFNWNNVPIVALFGVLGFAALPRLGMAFIAQVVFTLALVGVVWAQAGSQGFEPFDLLMAAIVAGVIVEAGCAAWTWVKRRRSAAFNQATRDLWATEVVWLSASAGISSTVFYWIVSRGSIDVDLLRLGAAAGLGAVGWFFGDLVQQYMIRRATNNMGVAR